MWEIHNNDQLLTFLYALVLGVLFCLAYDQLRAVRKVWHPGAVSVGAADFLFCVAGAFVTFLFLLSRTNGMVRGYVLAAMLCGFVLCRVSLSHLLFRPETVVLRFVRTVLRKISGGFAVGTAFLARKITAFSAFLHSFLKNTRKVEIKLLKKGMHLLYNRANNKC